MILFICTSATLSFAQDSIIHQSKKIEYKGYIKTLQSVIFDKNFRDGRSLNLLHNRLNIKWKPTKNITVNTEFRNRLLWGELVRQQADYTSLLKSKDVLFDLQKLWIRSASLLLHTNIERFYIDFRKERWSLRAGRQRINWGINNTWNPNDIFNVYNFLDFDYEERAGIDGISFRHLLGNLSNVEWVYANTGKSSGSVAAMRYSLNTGGYDLHFNAGWYKKHPTVGFGWAGNIKAAGFKGECQYFFNQQNTVAHLNVSTEFDYVFKKQLYLNIGMLYGSAGRSRPFINAEQLNADINPEKLMPSRWNAIIYASKEFTPLIAASVVVVHSFQTNQLTVIPSVKYSLATDVELNILAQLFFSEFNSSFQGVFHHFFLRLKWSF